jgi:hypothetical protein
MIVAAIENNMSTLENIVTELQAVLDLIGDPQNLSLQQALCLAALCLEQKPDILLDLGTGKGNSAVVFSVVGKVLEGFGHNLTVHTFDIQNRWITEALPKLDARISKRVVPHVGDLTEFDFDPILELARSVLVFWDAHGFAVADTVLTRIMPILAERRHSIVCHDISDNRFSPERRYYGGLPFWRGMDYFYNERNTTEINIGWLSAVVDQILPLTDFCFRNEIEIQSVDYSIRTKLAEDARARFFNIVAPTPQPALIHMAYWSMAGTPLRYFPASEKELLRAENDLSRRGVRQLYSIRLGRPECVKRNLEVNHYGNCEPRLSIKGDAVAFAPTTLRDHLASRFFDARSLAAPGGGDCVIVLVVDWPREEGRHPTLLLQTTDFSALVRVEAGAAATIRVSPAMAVGSCPDRLRVTLLFSEATEHLLPRTVRVLMGRSDGNHSRTPTPYIE